MTDTKEITSIVDDITADGSGGYKAEKGRYHLYVSNVCPFAHRVTVARELKGLQDVISLTNVSPSMSKPEIGWEFDPERPECGSDTVCGKKYLREIYEMSHPEYKGSITVPCLFDKKTKKIVNNESVNILRMLSTAFNEFCPTQEQKELDFYPEDKRKEIDEIVEELNKNVIYNVYKSRHAKSQQEYEDYMDQLFNTLDKMDDILSKNRFLTGPKLTEADIKLFVVLARFDMVFYSLLKCSKKMICQYDHLWPYFRDIYQTGTVSNSVKFQEIKEGYWSSKRYAAPTYWIPVGPQLDYNQPSGRK